MNNIRPLDRLIRTLLTGQTLMSKKIMFGVQVESNIGNGKSQDKKYKTKVKILKTGAINFKKEDSLPF